MIKTKKSWVQEIGPVVGHDILQGVRLVSMKPKPASYECLSSSCKYETNPGQTTCPMCGNIYIKWVNYKDFGIYKKRLDKR